MKLPDYIVDAHVHFWNPLRLNYPWLASVPALNRGFFPDDYSAATKTTNVGKMIFVECGCEPAQNHGEVKWVSELAASEPRLKGIIAHTPLERGASARDELALLAQYPHVKGIRQNLQGEVDANFCLRPDFVAGVRALAEFDFSFDVCIAHHQLSTVTELIRRCPEVRFILDHCGKPAIRQQRIAPWAKELKGLAALPNAFCKISGLLTEADLAKWQPADLQPFVRHTIDCFGFDRVLFGGDWPVLTLSGDYSCWLAALDFCLAGAGENDLKKLFQTNAENFYHL